MKTFEKLGVLCPSLAAVLAGASALTHAGPTEARDQLDRGGGEAEVDRGGLSRGDGDREGRLRVAQAACPDLVRSSRHVVERVAAVLVREGAEALTRDRDAGERGAAGVRDAAADAAGRLSRCLRGGAQSGQQKQDETFHR